MVSTYFDKKGDSNYCPYLLEPYFKPNAQPHCCTLQQYFEIKIHQLKRKDDWFMSIKDELYSFIRHISLGLRFLYQRKKPHLNLGDGIFITSGKIAKLGNMNEWVGTLKAGIKKDLKSLCTLIKRILELGSLKADQLHHLNQFLAELAALSEDATTREDYYLDDVNWLLDDPLFYSPSEGLGLMDKMYYLVFQAYVFNQERIDEYIYTHGELKALNNWIQNAKSSHFSAVLDYNFKKAATSKEDGKKAGTSKEDHLDFHPDDKVGVLRFYRNSLAHYLYTNHVGGRVMAYRTFENDLGHVAREMRKIIKIETTTINNPNLKKLLVSFLNSSHPLNEDEEVAIEIIKAKKRLSLRI